MENLKLVTEKINFVYSTHKFINKAKKLRLAYYSENCERLSKLNIDLIKGHDFNVEILKFSFELEKLEYVNRKLKKHLCIERHVFAPELNKILIFDQEIKAPGITEIKEALKFLVDYFSIESLKQIKSN